MLALVLMVGVVIDDAIVVLENIFRFVEEKGMAPFEAARAATAEIGLAVLATTLSLVVIFVPVSFMSSISGRFLYQFGLTAAVAVLVSLLVSFTLTPMMSARLLRREDAVASHGVGGAHETAAEPGEGVAPRRVASRGGFYAPIERFYTGMLAWSMEHRRTVAWTAVGVVALAVPLAGLVGREYLPAGVDEAEFDVNVNAPEGTSLAAMDEIMRTIEGEIRAVPHVRTTLVTAGGGFLGGVNQGEVYVRISPHSERTFNLGRLWRETLDGRPWAAFDGVPQREVMQDIRGRLRKYADLRTSVRNARSFNFGGGPAELDFVLRGPDLVALAGYAESLRARADELGLVDADTTLKLDKPELRVVIDRERAADLGVDSEEIAQALRLMVGGDSQVSRFHDPAVNDDYDVQLRLEGADRDDPASIARLWVPRDGPGDMVRLDNVVRLEQGQTASRIDRLDRQRQVSVRAGVAPGYALADRLQALREATAEMNLPAAYSTAVSGRAREFERTSREFGWAFVLSVLFMYMILASQYESLIHPVTILLSLPLSVPFALFSLWITGNTLNLYSALGILVLFGVVKKNAILQVDHTNRLRAQGMERLPAILQANRDRLRPILMTTMALVAGMLPLALGSGPGAEERRAVAVVVIGGQSLCLLLTLLVTPVAYSYLDDIVPRLRATWHAAAEGVRERLRARRPRPT
jgi:HAE1 family hydrophobic/amphiphilic exporter-1